MRWAAYARQASIAISRGTQYLLANQDRTGLWHDYFLPPGPSDAWSTAWVGWSLAAAGDPAARARRQAATALLALRQRDGWGYNRSTGADADTTAWTVRFLASLGALGDAPVHACLTGYLDALGHAHTFPGMPSSWGAAHADVTPAVGLALLAVAAPQETVLRVRQAVLSARTPGGGWRSFWWSTDAYATAWALAFLSRSGGIPARVRSEDLDWLAARRASASALESACLLLAAATVSCGSCPIATNFVDELLDAFDSAAGAWCPSPVLLVPSTDSPGGSNADTAHADGNRLMTTAISCAALRRWLRAAVPA